MRNRVRICLAAVGLMAWILGSYGQETMRPITADNLQYDNEGPYQLFDRPHKKQGLDTLLSRGRVSPRNCWRKKAIRPLSDLGQRADYLSRDEYTGAEIWRLTNFPSGVVRHAYSGIPAWNANGHFIQIRIPTRATILLDQESCTLTFRRVFLAEDLKTR